ncbi:hypothetical protein [Yersinia enterocolitica]
MNEKPILFNAEMVNAILSGRKTQTRRIISEKTLHLFGVAASAGECHPIELCDQRSQSYYLDFFPLGKPGDQLSGQPYETIYWTFPILRFARCRYQY